MVIIFAAKGFRPSASIPVRPKRPKYKNDPPNATAVTMTASKYRMEVSGVKNGDDAADLKLLSKLTPFALVETLVLYRGETAVRTSSTVSGVEKSFASSAVPTTNPVASVRRAVPGTSELVR